MEPAREVGGTVRFLHLDAEHLFFLVGDVSEGLPCQHLQGLSAKLCAKVLPFDAGVESMIAP